MRIARALVVARMLFIFFVRRALSAGALRLRSVRIGIALAATVYVAGTTAAAYQFLDGLTEDPAVWGLLFDATTVSTILWVLIALLIVKVLFVHADGMLELTFQLPVTNRERALALLVYEVAMTGVIAAGGLFALCTCSVALLGVASVEPVLTSLVLPAVLTYLVVSVLHQLLTRLWVVLRLDRIAGVLNIVALFGLVIVGTSRSQALVGEITGAYLQGREAHLWVTAVSRLQRSIGTAPTVLAVLLAVATLSALVVALSPRRHVHQGRYVRLWTGRKLRRLLNPYDLSLLRSSQTVTAVVLALLVHAWLAARGTNPVWAVAVVPFSGLYQFSSTTPLRIIYGGRHSPLHTFGLMIRAQAVLVVPLTAVFAVVATCLDTAWAGATWTTLGATVVTSVVMVGIGVIFPTEKDNPLAVLVGVTSVAMVAALGAMAIGMLNLPAAAVVTIACFAVLMFATYSVLGISTDNSRRRHETHTSDRQHRRRFGDPDAHDLRGIAAGHDVHGRQLR